MVAIDSLMSLYTQLTISFGLLQGCASRFLLSVGYFKKLLFCVHATNVIIFISTRAYEQFFLVYSKAYTSVSILRISGNMLDSTEERLDLFEIVLNQKLDLVEKPVCILRAR